jgi:TM2 domain-containing membrane protein YozV
MPGPIVSGVASLIVPGLGQVLNGKYLRGIVVFIAAIVLISATAVIVLPLAILMTLIVLIASAADAYKIAKGAASMA